MKKLRSIIAQIASIDKNKKDELNDLLWEFICYSPQWMVRPHQQLLLDEADKFSMKVYDEHFSKSELKVNGFKWGNGKQKILLTHGWGSKGADFYELITALKQLDLTIITFDAPGNGSSEGSLSNLLLYAGGVKAVIERFGAPDISIGHSLGAMANVVGLRNTPPLLLVSLSPLIRLKENFIASLNSLQIPESVQANFFNSFEQRFDVKPSNFNMTDVYHFDSNIRHWLAYDDQDVISPYPYLEEYLLRNPAVIPMKFKNVGHEKIIKDEVVIKEIIRQVTSALA